MSGLTCGISYFIKQLQKKGKQAKNKGEEETLGKRHEPPFHLSLDPPSSPRTSETPPCPSQRSDRERERARPLWPTGDAAVADVGVVLLVSRELSKDSAGEETDRNQLHRHQLRGCRRKQGSTPATRRAVEGTAWARGGRGEVRQQLAQEIETRASTRPESILLSPFYGSFSLESRWIIFNSLRLVLIRKVFTVDYVYMCIEVETFDYIYILTRLGRNGY